MARTPLQGRARDIHREGGVLAPWLVTYSDMVTLLLTFFVFLFALSRVDVGRFTASVQSIQKALGSEGRREGASSHPAEGETSPVEPETPPADEASVIQNIIAREMRELRQVGNWITSELEAKGMSGVVAVELEERGLVVRFSEGVLFDRGKADLKPEAVKILGQVASILAKVPNHIRVEGHTCDLPISTPEFPSNWELSTARAIRVLRFLAEHGFDPGKLSAAGYGEYHPLVPNVGEEQRKLNRRVDLVLVRPGLVAMEPD